ncbi:hypothetical protein EMST110833_07290 [Empedobacter stercoris]
MKPIYITKFNLASLFAVILIIIGFLECGIYLDY